MFHMKVIAPHKDNKRKLGHIEELNSKPWKKSVHNLSNSFYFELADVSQQSPVVAVFQ